MKTKLLTLFSLLALLLVSTALLADGRPTGIRIGRAVSGGGTNVEIDVTITRTGTYYGFSDSNTAWLGNQIRTFFGSGGQQYASYSRNVPLPWGIEWGDGYYLNNLILRGPPGGPFVGTFSHTYSIPDNYTITAGDASCCAGASTVNSGNPTYGYTRYVWTWDKDDDQTFNYATTYPVLLAITNTATVSTGTGIPTLNIYGFLALAFVLVGTGLLVYRKPQRT